MPRPLSSINDYEGFLLLLIMVIGNTFTLQDFPNKISYTRLQSRILHRVLQLSMHIFICDVRTHKKTNPLAYFTCVSCSTWNHYLIPSVLIA